MAPRPAAAAGALLLLALAAWWFLDRQAGPPPPPPPSAPGPLDSRPSTPPPLLPPTLPLEDAQWRDDRTGLWLSGQVLAAPEERPLAGAVVSAIPAGSSFGQPESCAAWATAASDPDGRFRIGPLPSQELLLIARAPERARLALRLIPREPQEPLLLRLEPGRDLGGLVLDEATGAPLPGARIVSEHGEGPSTEAGPDGRFILEGLPRDRAVALAAQAPTHQARAIVHAPGEPEPRLFLAPNPLLRLLLLRPAGSPEPNRIRLTGTRLGTGDEPVAASAGRAPWWAEEPWPLQGELRLERLEPGWHDLRVEALGEPALAGETGAFRLEPGKILDQTLALRPAPALRGRILDGRGTPLAGVEVWAPQGGPPIRTDAQGRFYLAPLQERPGTLVARIPGVAALALDLAGQDLGTGRNLGDLLLPDRTGRVTGTVRNGEGEPIPGALVVLAAPGLPPGLWSARTGRLGAFDLAGLPWGTWELFLWPAGSSPPLSFAGPSPAARFTLTPERPTADLPLVSGK